MDLFRANLKKARLTNISLRDANLVKVDLTRSRLSQVNIQDANLMGVQLRGAKLDKVDWGKVVLNERLGDDAEQNGKEDQAFQFYREALSVYQHLGRVYERNRDRRMASRLFLREMEMQRKLMPKGSVERRWSTLVDLVCGYGEKPFRIIPFAIVLIAFCAGLYSLFGAFGTDIDLGFMGGVALVENAYDFVDCLIYSAMIFISLGYTELAYAGIRGPSRRSRPLLAG